VKGPGRYYNAGVMDRLVRSRRAAAGATLMAVLGLLAGACGGTPPKPPQKELVVWKTLGMWSGRGNSQTESFFGLTGALRMTWRTHNETPAGSGRFRLILQSAISGRDLQEVVDEKGQSDGTAYVADDPRVFQISVESANLDWSFSVEEAVFGRAAFVKPRVELEFRARTAAGETTVGSCPSGRLPRTSHRTAQKVLAVSAADR
jgi:hypothetical protein